MAQAWKRESTDEGRAKAAAARKAYVEKRKKPCPECGVNLMRGTSQRCLACHNAALKKKRSR